MVDEEQSVWVFISFSYQNACREDRSCWDLWKQTSPGFCSFYLSSKWTEGGECPSEEPHPHRSLDIPKGGCGKAIPAPSVSDGLSPMK